MGWSIGFDSNWNRDIGYGVPTMCDHPECDARIDRGLSYVCAHQEPYGGEEGCGLYFCHAHLSGTCERCATKTDDAYIEPFAPKPDLLVWIQHKLTDESWKEWRDAHPGEVADILARLGDA
jgi:hypothetical protein